MQQEFSRKAGIRGAWVVALCLAGCPVLASAETIKAQLSTAPNVPPPITRSTPATVVVEMEAKEYVGTIAEGVQYKFWSFNGTVPGPMIRVRVGDTVQIHLTNSKDSSESHNIDFHAVNGPGGGAAMLNTEPGEKTGLSFKAINPGLYVYHCATASPSIPAHIANGMYGMILVEPEGGLPPVDKEFYLLQSDFYTKEAGGFFGGGGDVLEFDHAKGSAEHPTYVVYNGMVGSLVKNPLTAKVGDRIRIFFGNAGPNLVSSWHIIGGNIRQGLDGRFAHDPTPGKRANHAGAGCGLYHRGIYRGSARHVYFGGPLDLSHRERRAGSPEGGRGRETRHL